MRKELKIAIFISLLFMGGYLGVYYNQTLDLSEFAALSFQFFIGTYILTVLNFQFHKYLNRHYPWSTQTEKRFSYGLIGSVVISMLVFLLFRLAVFMLLQKASISSFIAQESPENYILAFVASLLATAFFHLFYFYKAIQEKKLSTHKLKAGAATAQLDALKNQLDPHFLFNSLNVLSSLIEESPEKAQDFTTTLSRVYRYVLDKKHEDLVTLEEEISFGKAYMKLLKMRFEDGLHYSFPLAESQAAAKIAPLSLQLLLENTIKHNIVSKEQPLVIKVYLKNGFLVVENNKQVKSTLHSSGLGLQNIINRYATLTKESIEILSTESIFKVSIPLILNPIQMTQTTHDLLEDKRYHAAKEKVKKIIGFYYHLFAFVVVMTFLGWLNYSTTDFPWVLFPLLGWGMGILEHALEAFDKSLFFGKNWEERQIASFIAKEEQANNKYKNN